EAAFFLVRVGRGRHEGDRAVFAVDVNATVGIAKRGGGFTSFLPFLNAGREIDAEKTSFIDAVEQTVNEDRAADGGRQALPEIDGIDADTAVFLFKLDEPGALHVAAAVDQIA